MTKPTAPPLGEFERIARFFAPLAGPGALNLTDDVALIDGPAGEQYALTTDTIIEGVDYFPDDPPDLVAKKLLRVNLSDLAAKGAHYGLITIPAGGSRKPFARDLDANETLMIMSDGQAVYAKAVAMMTGSAEIALAKAGIAANDVTHFIPHQANARMMGTVAQQIGVKPQSLRSTIAQFGNSSAATIPLTLSVSADEKTYKLGDTILMTAAGAGLTGGAAVFRW